MIKSILGVVLLATAGVGFAEGTSDVGRQANALIKTNLVCSLFVRYGMTIDDMKARSELEHFNMAYSLFSQRNMAGISVDGVGLVPFPDFVASLEQGVAQDLARADSQVGLSEQVKKNLGAYLFEIFGKSLEKETGYFYKDCTTAMMTGVRMLGAPGQ